MKSVYLGIGLVLALTLTPASADTECRKSAEGDVSCQRVPEDSTLDSKTTDQQVDHPSVQGEPEPTEHEQEKTQGGNVGDKSTQSKDPGITY